MVAYISSYLISEEQSQESQRAVIVGEVTGGGAHPTSSRRIDDHFTISVPSARAINPITRTNWEGTGVQPDVKVPASEALAKALQLIAQRAPLPGRSPQPEARVRKD